MQQLNIMVTLRISTIFKFITVLNLILIVSLYIGFWYWSVAVKQQMEQAIHVMGIVVDQNIELLEMIDQALMLKEIEKE